MHRTEYISYALYKTRLTQLEIVCWLGAVLTLVLPTRRNELFTDAPDVSRACESRPKLRRHATVERSDLKERLAMKWRMLRWS
jgi:hypothetical protein